MVSMLDNVYKVVYDLETAINNYYKVEEIKPSDFKSNAKLDRMIITLSSSQTGEPKTIRALVEEEAHALRDFIQKQGIIDI
jgi:hypothetical protein